MVDSRLTRRVDDDGQVWQVCQECIEWTRYEDLAIDPADGLRWDICQQCRGPVVECRMHSIAIQSDCFPRSFWFYTEVLNLPVHRPPFTYKTRLLTWIDAGSALIELYSTKDSSLAEERPDPLNGIDHVAFSVDNLADITAVLNHHDIPITRKPFVPPSGDPEQPWVMFARAPEGTEIQFRGAKGTP